MFRYYFYLLLHKLLGIGRCAQCGKLTKQVGYIVVNGEEKAVYYHKKHLNIID